MGKTMMKHILITFLMICLFAVCGVAEEQTPFITVGKDVTVTYDVDDVVAEVLFYPENTVYQCYKVTATVLDASSDIPYITCYASYGHEGWSNGTGLGPEANLRKSNPEASFWTTLFKKDGDEPNMLIVDPNIPYDWQENYDPNAFITVKWHIEKLIGLRDPMANVEVTLSQKTLYYSGTGEKPKPTVTSVTAYGKKLQEGRDYRVSDPWYTSDTEGGITVFGEGAYGDLIRESFFLTSKKAEESGTKKTEEPSGKTVTSGDKKSQPMTVTATRKVVKLKKLKKKKQVVSPITVKSAQGAVSYKITVANKKSKKALKINAKTGKITVKKGTKKGTYRVKVTVTAAGNSEYEAGSRTVEVSVVVK